MTGKNIIEQLIDNGYIGFDFQNRINPAYPPYNIKKISDDKFTIEMALSGFKKSELNVTLDKNILHISGYNDQDTDVKYLHKGISNKNFNRKFTLDEYIEVEDVKFENGLLSVELVKKIPEDEKPLEFKIK